MADCRELSTLPLSRSIIDLLLQNGFRYVGRSLPACEVYPSKQVTTIVFNIVTYPFYIFTHNISVGIASIFKDDLNGMKPTDLVQEINITADVAHSVSIQICHALRYQHSAQFDSSNWL